MTTRVVEEPLYEWWERHGFSRRRSRPNSGSPIRIPSRSSFPCPPPNVTGALHLGHAITNSVEDMLIRYNPHALDPPFGFPGTDHGIATQNVVERKLDEQGLTRHDLGRDNPSASLGLERRVPRSHLRSTAAYGHLLRLWRRRFTLDDSLNDAVLDHFHPPLRRGLIYRAANYLVNWCPRCTSAISDLEVEYEVHGNFYTFRYPLKEGGFLEGQHHPSRNDPE